MRDILPADIKVKPYYDRSDLVQLTIDTVEHNMLVGMALVLIVLMAFLVSIRAAVIVPSPSPWLCYFHSSSCMREEWLQICFRLAPSISEFSSTGPW